LIARIWSEVGGARIEIEPKDKMKIRVGYSPDYADWLATAVEGARRRGFQIAKMANPEAQEQGYQWLDDLRKKARASWSKGMLVNP
jgi:hypothetical protein